MVIEDIILRIVLSIIIGGCVGYEREYKNRPAGFRTNILVCVGSTIVSLIQISIGNDAISLVNLNNNLLNIINVDYARLGAQVITGVGFLGAGTIIHTKGSIKGLTTAASLWAVAILGLAIGMGYYNLSIFGAIAIVVSLGLFKRFEDRFMKTADLVSIEIRYIEKDEATKLINDIFRKYFIKIKSIDCEEKNYETIKNIYTVRLEKNIDMNNILHQLIDNTYIISVKVIN